MQRLSTFFLVISFGLFPVLAEAQVGVDYNSADWFDRTSSNTQTTGAVGVDFLGADDCNGLIVNAAASTVYVRSNLTGILIGSYTTGGTIENKPALAKLKDGKWYVFVTCTDGKLYKIDVAAGVTIAKTGGVGQIVSLRRSSDAGCAVKDKLDASPVVQLQSQSNTGYSLGKDIVMVATHDGCSSATTNRFYAFDAADITQPPVWVFNQFGDYSVDYCVNFILDTSRNAIFCATNLSAGRFQNTIWRINTVTGNLDWAGNFNSIHSRPVLGNPALGNFNHLYAVDMLSRLHAVNPDTGTEDWNIAITGVAGEYDDLPLSIGEADYVNEIFTTTSAGRMAAVYDNGYMSGGGELLWSISPPPGIIKPMTGIATLSTAGKYYVGLNDGTVHQFNMATGSDEGFSLAYTLPDPTGSLRCAELLVYNTGLRYKIVQSYWGSSGTILQYNIPNFVVDPALKTWKGNISSAWENPSNWIPMGVPDSTKDVLIKCGAYVIISSVDAICHSLEVQPSAGITVNPGFKLTVHH